MWKVCDGECGRVVMVRVREGCDGECVDGRFVMVSVGGL